LWKVCQGDDTGCNHQGIRLRPRIAGLRYRRRDIRPGNRCSQGLLPTTSPQCEQNSHDQVSTPNLMKYWADRALRCILERCSRLNTSLQRKSPWMPYQRRPRGQRVAWYMAHWNRVWRTSAAAVNRNSIPGLCNMLATIGGDTNLKFRKFVTSGGDDSSLQTYAKPVPLARRKAMSRATISCDRPAAYHRVLWHHSIWMLPFHTSSEQLPTKVTNI
jgi:hypothetical protein